jgi:hypothetical protein
MVADIEEEEKLFKNGGILKPRWTFWNNYL